MKYSNTDNSLNITSPTGININSGDSNITIKRNNNPKIVVEESNIELDVNSLTVKPNSGNVATISTSATNGFILKSGDSQANLATVEMGKLKLKSLCDVTTGAEQVSVSKDLIEVKRDLKVDNSLEVINNLKVDNILTPRYIGTTGGRLDFSYDIPPVNPKGTSLHINTSSPSDKSKINKFVFFAGDGDKDTETEKSPKADVVANTFWADRMKTNLLDVESDAAVKVLLATDTLLFKNSFACRISDTGGSNNGPLNREIIVRSEAESTTYLDIENIRNITVSGIIKTTSNADNAIDASKGTVKAQSFNAVSDKRLKENIVEYSPNKSILDLPIYSYNFISDEKKTKKIGCLAQDLKEICPEIVKEDDKGYLSIEENKIVYLLLDEIKKLKKRVDELEAR